MKRNKQKGILPFLKVIDKSKVVAECETSPVISCSNQALSKAHTKEISTDCYVASIDGHCSSSSAPREPAEGRLFRNEWARKHPWLKYEDEKGKVFCEICCKAVNVIQMPLQKITAAEMNSMEAFVKEGFCNWKKALKRFETHERSSFHRACVSACFSVGAKKNIVKELSSSKAKEMNEARTALLCIITSLRYLCVQGLAIRGHSDEHSNLHELLRLRSEDNSALKSWLSRTKYKWVSHDIQEEILTIMSTEVQRTLVKDVKESEFFSIIADETADITQKEQISICIRTVQGDLKIKECFMGFYQTKSTDAVTLYRTVMDVLTRYDMPLKQCRGQCYDGAANVSGKLSGLQSRIIANEPRAVFVHCSAHSLSLVVQDAMQSIPAIRNYLNIMREIITYVRISPKRRTCFEMLQSSSDTLADSKQLRPFCPTRWCLRIVSLKTLEEHYGTMIELLRELCNDKGESGAKAHGFLKRLQTFETVLFTHILILVLSEVEDLNRNLQACSLNFADVGRKVQKLQMFLCYLRESKDVFDDLWNKATERAKSLCIEVQQQQRKKKIPKKYEERPENEHQFETAKEKYRKVFFEVLDIALSSLDERFGSETMSHLEAMERFAIGNGDASAVTDFYKDDFNADRLKLHRDMFLDIARNKGVKMQRLSDIVKFAEELDTGSAALELVTEFSRFLKCMLTIPVSTCTAERSFSSLRRLKTYLRSTMQQQRLNAIAVLHVHRAETMELDPEYIANEFISRASVRRNTFSMRP